MKSQMSGLISLEQAHELVALLSAGEQLKADELLRELSAPIQKELFDEVGKLTRQLHSALADFQIDNRLIELTSVDIPDAKERLNYVIDMTEQAANKTMDAVEECLPLADALITQIQAVSPGWSRLMRRDLALSEFKSLCHDVQQLLSHSAQDADRLRELLSQILMAQGFQDLTGQMIRRVIELVREVENNLVSMLTVFGEASAAEIATTNPSHRASHSASRKGSVEAEGPIPLSQQRQDVMTGQDEVDDLLSSLGF